MKTKHLCKSLDRVYRQRAFVWLPERQSDLVESVPSYVFKPAPVFAMEMLIGTNCISGCMFSTS